MSARRGPTQAEQNADTITAYEHRIATMNDERDTLRADNARLREALTTIRAHAAGHDTFTFDHANNALSGTGCYFCTALAKGGAE